MVDGGQGRRLLARGLLRTLAETVPAYALRLGFCGALHELGHAVLHRRLPSIEEAETELQAFSFAAALLLPTSEFDRHRGPHGFADADLADIARVDAATLGELFPDDFRRRALKAVSVSSGR